MSSAVRGWMDNAWQTVLTSSSVASQMSTHHVSRSKPLVSADKVDCSMSRPSQVDEVTTC